MLMSHKQHIFWNNCTHRWNIKVGATRSGKTYMDYFLIMKRIRACQNKGMIAIIGNTRSTIERNILDPMRELFSAKLIGQPKPNNTVKMFGKKVHLFGADKVSQVSKLQGGGIEYCYGDEITTWNEQVFQMLKSRLDKDTSKFDGTCNPDNPNHWFKKFLESDADIYVQHYTIDDNPFLDEEFVDNLKKEYEGTVFYDRYILGEWMRAEGLVYQNYNPSTDALDEVPEPLNGQVYVSVDYGIMNPCVFLMWEQGVSGAWYLTDEYYYNGRDLHRQKTDSEYLEDFRAFTAGKNIKGVVVDPSASSFIVALHKNGYRVAKAANDVMDGIRTTMVLLNSGQIKVLRSCENTIKEFGAYCWDDSSVQDEPIKENDHAMDAMRYFAFTILRQRTGGVYAV